MSRIAPSASMTTAVIESDRVAGTDEASQEGSHPSPMDPAAASRVGEDRNIEAEPHGNDRTAILVLGMHRSGTSAVTRVINLLGADLPSNLMPAIAGNNDAGFWESLDAYRLNDEILESAGSNWDDWRRFASDWFRSPVKHAFKDRAIRMLEQDFAKSSLFVLKDPRICRILPFWVEVFREFGAEPKCVIPIRNPLEVAASLKRRDGFSPARSHMLWLRHVLDAELDSRHLGRAFLAYETMLDDWRGAIGTLSSALDFAWPRRSATAEVEIDRFLEHRHRHHESGSASVMEHPDLAVWVKEVFSAVLDLVKDPGSEGARERLDTVRSEFDRASDAFGSVVRSEEMAHEEFAAASSAQFTELEEIATAREVRIGELEKGIGELEGAAKQLGELEKREKQRETRLSELGQTAARRKARISGLEEATARREARIDELEEIAAQREARIGELEKIALQRAVRMDEMEEVAAQREASIDELEAAAARREAWISELGEIAAQRQERIDEQEQASSVQQQRMQQRMQELNDTVALQEAGMSELRSRLAAEQAQLHETETLSNRVLLRLNEIQTSASGQLTNPLRALESRWPTLVRGVALLPKLVWWALTLRLPQRLRTRKLANALLDSGLFDRVWYVEQNPDVVLNGLNPVLHWLVSGWAEGRNPNRLFYTDWYLEQNPGVAAAGLNPLVHYLTKGAAEGRDPCPLFDSDWYLARNPAVAKAGINPLAHYLTKGAAEGSDPNPLFDSQWYLAQNPDIAKGGLDPLTHYLGYGAAEGRDPNPLFDSDWYIERYPAVAQAGVNPLAHYLQWGAAEGYDPNALFSTRWYLARHHDLASQGINPLAHYLEHDLVAECDPNPLFDTDWYLATNPDLLTGTDHPLAHYLQAGGREQRDPSPLFDTKAYLEHYPEVAERGLNPLAHYLSNARNGKLLPFSPRTQIDVSPTCRDNSTITIASTTAVLDDEPEGIPNYCPAARWADNLNDFRPDVTVIVPCYNHAPYLRERLDSIYGQSYPPAEVLLLDDCSNDGSREILREYAERYPEFTTLLFNEQNSGSVFRQWKRGIEAAKSPLVWVAESDDLCDLDFLEKLVAFFADEAVMLAYSHSVFIDEQGEPSGFRFEDYVGELARDKWGCSYVETAHREVEVALGRKNSIPNVSSAVFRHPREIVMPADAGWESMRICGDWLFYLYLIRGGKLAYSTDTHNYYRIHSTNASAATYATPAYYREHETIARYIGGWYKVSMETLTAHRAFIARFFDQQGQALAREGHDLDTFYSSEKVLSAVRDRTPNVLIASFSFTLGGGEVFPIRLANALKQQGFSVTFFDFGGAEHNENMRRMLDNDIPLIECPDGAAGAAKVLDDYGIEVVHTHHASTDQFFAEAKALTSNPPKLLVTMHGMYEAMPGHNYRHVFNKIKDVVDAWVYIADKNIVPFRRIGAYSDSRFTKIPNGMAVEEIHPVDRSTYDIPEDAFVVCSASRAIPEKGWRVAIEAIGEARVMAGMDIVLILLGDGPVYEELRQETLPPYVRIPGFVNDAVDFYAMADLGLLSSIFKGESFPLTVIECLMAGRPIIASDVGEVSAMLSNDRGELAGELIDVASGVINVTTLAGQITALATDRSAYDGKARIAREVAPRFKMDAVLAQYTAVYQSLSQESENP